MSQTVTPKPQDQKPKMNLEAACCSDFGLKTHETPKSPPGLRVVVNMPLDSIDESKVTDFVGPWGANGVTLDSRFNSRWVDAVRPYGASSRPARRYANVVQCALRINSDRVTQQLTKRRRRPSRQPFVVKIRGSRPILTALAHARLVQFCVGVCLRVWEVTVYGACFCALVR